MNNNKFPFLKSNINSDVFEDFPDKGMFESSLMVNLFMCIVSMQNESNQKVPVQWKEDWTEEQRNDPFCMNIANKLKK